MEINERKSGGVLTANDGSEMDCFFVFKNLAVIKRSNEKSYGRLIATWLFYKSNCAFAMHFVDQGYIIKLDITSRTHTTRFSLSAIKRVRAMSIGVYFHSLALAGTQV